MRLAIGSLFFLILPMVASAAAPIYLKPGQCLLVGEQQVCALKDDATTSRPAPRPGHEQTMDLCRYGAMENMEPKDAKGWSLVRVTIKDDGSKVETIINSYGPLEEHKKECEAANKRGSNLR